MSAGPVLTVDTGDPTPPFEQVRRQIAALVEAGSLHVGERLPPLRQLASDLDLAVGTVARSYRELEAAGLVVSRRGGGTRVLGPSSSKLPDETLRALAEDFVARARGTGADDAAIASAVQAATVRAAASAPSAPAAVPALSHPAAGRRVAGLALPASGPATAGIA